MSKLRSKHHFFKVDNCLKALIYLGTAVTLTACQSHLEGGVLYSKGLIAAQERELFVDALALMLIVVLPVIVMSFTFAYKYRVKANNKDYKPTWSHNVFLEAVWWGIPTVIIICLGILTWKKTHQLDPYKKIPRITGEVLKIQAIALPWNWLFIYPKENVATLNYLQLPNEQQVEFFITADAPMSAFAIPQLGSQIYAMAGMRTRLHLYPLYTGSYEGMNTQYSGEGFADMKFKVEVVKPKQFTQWVSAMKNGHPTLTWSSYKTVAKPSIKHPVELYSNVKPKLFQQVMHQYMMPNMQMQ